MPRTRPSALTISVTTSPQPPWRFTRRRNAVSVMPAIGATANGDGRLTEPIFMGRQYAFTSAASTSTLTAWPMRFTDSTSRAFGASLRIRRPMTPRSGPCTTSTIIPS